MESLDSMKKIGANIRNELDLQGQEMSMVQSNALPPQRK